jgi:hypothetical protein
LTLLYFDARPHWRETERHLRALTDEFADVAFRQHPVDAPEEAKRVGFHGSPSVLVDGIDAFAEPDAPVGIACRVYPTPDGPAGSPTIDQLRAALVQRR